MALKSHSFSYNLMLEQAIQDCVHTDMLVIDQLKSLSEDERVLALSDLFNLSSQLTRRINDKQLYIALFEASTLINRNVENIEDVISLRQACAKKTDHKLIRQMVEKYEITIELYAMKMSPFSQSMLCNELKCSRRGMAAVKAVLKQNITLEAKKIETEWRENELANPTLRKYMLIEAIKDIQTNYDDAKKGVWYNTLWVLTHVLKSCQLYINQVDSKQISDIIDSVRLIQEDKKNDK
ncbi:hypothetical protein [Enterovibrio norvegicus]|uniref:hypothetical protein n=1 Tax=Enterovibrio norvegicus TaxID=188144 RepID=UPI000C823267|nr:hypothetical protein [Enterovibrio norvegicus]PMH64566.1 hypothetical protein BCU62_16045 [Enterovibrio norvegicus]